MKKRFFQFGMALLAVVSTAVFTSCSDDEDSVPSYQLTIQPQLPEGFEATEIKDVKITYVSSSKKKTVKLDALQETTLTLRQGDYKVTVQGNIGDGTTGTVVGSGAVSLYENTTMAVTLEKVSKSALIFKTIHNSGSKQYYMKESYFEIVNNSDEVQYLDGVILMAPSGNSTIGNAWQSNGITNLYESGQGSVLAFPGTGKDYPLEPGKSVLVANNAYNHTLAYGDDETQKEDYAMCPDLSNADWEIYLDYNANDVDYDAPNLDVIFYNNKYMFAFGLGVMGRSYILAKLPAGITPAEFAADPANIQTTPGTSSTMQYLMMPSKYVLDAVDIYNPESETHVPTFLAADDVNGVKGNAAYSAKCMRRKVTKIANGRPYYQDTNNSADDFLSDQPLTPGVTPTTVD